MKSMKTSLQVKEVQGPEIRYMIRDQGALPYWVLGLMDLVLSMVFRVICRPIPPWSRSERQGGYLGNGMDLGCRRIVAMIVFGSAILNSREKAHSATNYVSTGQSLQTVINNSAPNDTIVVSRGLAMDPSVILSIPLTVVGGTTNVNILSPVQLTGVGDSRFQGLHFANTVMIQSTGTISIVGCTFGLPVISSNASVVCLSNTFSQDAIFNLTTGVNTNLQAFDSTFSTVTVTGGKILMKRCNVGRSNGSNNGITLLGTSLDAIRLTNVYGITSQGSRHVPITLFQCILGTNAFPGEGYNDAGQNNFVNNDVWIGYCSISGFLHCSACRMVMIGAAIANSSVARSTLSMDNGCELHAFNNIFTSNLSWPVDLTDTTASFSNDTLYGATYGLSAQGVGMISMNGVVVKGKTSGGSSIIWNISDCAFSPPAEIGSPLGGFGGCNGCVADFGFVNPGWDPVVSRFYLKSNSVLIANGPSDSVYNNRGTANRNDIGYTGGPFLNPANYTNDNPLVYLLTGAPQIFTKGRTNTIVVNAAAVAGD